MDRRSIGIIETGYPPDSLRPRFGTYSRMFEELLGPAFDYTVFEVQKGHWPARPEDHDGFIVTGSAAGVYEDDPWIGELLDWLRAAKVRSRLVGVCFGHQAMAQALGGEVIKSPKGWGAGLHRYEVVHPQRWTNGERQVAIPASHQDQVVRQPPNTEVVARSDFTPFAALAWTDRPAAGTGPGCGPCGPIPAVH